MIYITGIKRLISIITVLCLFLSFIPLSFGDTITGEADVGNASPTAVGLDVASASVDPESTFVVNTEVSDNNTLSDIENVILKVYKSAGVQSDPDDKRNHYTFWFDPSDNSWHSGIGTNIIGDPYIDVSNSAYPTDLTVNQDNYKFVIRLNGTANPMSWNAYLEVVDTQLSSDYLEKGDEFSVNNYVSYNVDIGTIEWSNLTPGSSNIPSDNNPISVQNIETNADFDVQNKLSGDWTNGVNEISSNNTVYANADAGGSSGVVTSTFTSVYSGIAYGENLSRGIKYYLDVPTGTPPGTYTNTFTIEVVQSF